MPKIFAVYAHDAVVTFIHCRSIYISIYLGSDYYQYPAVPHVTAVYSDGCQVADTTIYNCATVGGVTLNITGEQLNAPLMVTVAQVLNA